MGKYMGNMRKKHGKIIGENHVESREIWHFSGKFHLDVMSSWFETALLRSTEKNIKKEKKLILYIQIMATHGLKAGDDHNEQPSNGKGKRRTNMDQYHQKWIWVDMDMDIFFETSMLFLMFLRNIIRSHQKQHGSSERWRPCRVDHEGWRYAGNQWLKWYYGFLREATGGKEFPYIYKPFCNSAWHCTTL